MKDEKKGRTRREQKKVKSEERKGHSKSMMSNREAKIYTQHVPLSHNTEGKVRGKELETVWDDTNG